MDDNQSFSHVDHQGNPSMVDVSLKAITHRTATAKATVHLPPSVIEKLQGEEIHTKKGPVLQTAILAGIMGAKKTSELIPLCHPLALENCKVSFQWDDHQQLVIYCTAEITGKTGVEMEALTGAGVAALTVYDMCKAFSHDIVIKDICLMEKSGGKRDFKRK
ncbi:MAG: cyclic pyranopterin monophosphate synthase MoaC [Saprospiraceae bacterium]|nr:cyclic pyranopterin monophosphate synthase MoaC [Saprospiraceae bacterium]